jgi:hypothetical protein
MSYSKVQNQLVKTKQGSIGILRLLKLGLDFFTHELCNFTHLLFHYPPPVTWYRKSNFPLLWKTWLSFCLMMKIQNIVYSFKFILYSLVYNKYFKWLSLSDMHKSVLFEIFKKKYYKKFIFEFIYLRCRF